MSVSAGFEKNQYSRKSPLQYSYACTLTLISYLSKNYALFVYISVSVLYDVKGPAIVYCKQNEHNYLINNAIHTNGLLNINGLQKPENHDL